MPKKFIRTVGGGIWEWEKSSKTYRVPNCATVIQEGDDSIIGSSDDVLDLVRVGDLIVFDNECGRLAETQDIANIKKLKINKIFTSSPYFPETYSLVAFNKSGMWFVR